MSEPKEDLEKYPNRYGSFGFTYASASEGQPEEPQESNHEIRLNADGEMKPIETTPRPSNDALMYIQEWHSKGIKDVYLPEDLAHSEDDPPEDWEETERTARQAETEADGDYLEMLGPELTEEEEEAMEDDVEVCCNPDCCSPSVRDDADSSDSVSPRESLLDEAKSLVMGDRNNTYGPPTQDFQRSADAMNAMGYRSASGPLRAHDVAILVTLIKISRLQWSPQKRDHWADLAGYAACGWECVSTTPEHWWEEER